MSFEDDVPKKHKWCLCNNETQSFVNEFESFWIPVKQCSLIIGKLGHNRRHRAAHITAAASADSLQVSLHRYDRARATSHKTIKSYDAHHKVKFFPGKNLYLKPTSYFLDKLSIEWVGLAVGLLSGLPVQKTWRWCQIKLLIKKILALAMLTTILYVFFLMNQLSHLHEKWTIGLTLLWSSGFLLYVHVRMYTYYICTRQAYS